MNKFNVYIVSKKRSIGSKVDYSIIFEKAGVIWYRFAHRIIDKNNIGGEIGCLEGMKKAIVFAKEHNIFITVHSLKHIIEPQTLEGKINSNIKSSKKYRNDYCKDYIKLLNDNSDMFEFKFIKSYENPYFEYGIKTAENKFKKAV